MEPEWKSAKLGDYFDLIGGYAFKSEHFTESGVPVVKIKNVKSNRMLYDDLSYVDPEFLQTRSDKIIKRGDLLITMSGNRLDGTPETWVGKVAQFNEERPHLLNQRVGILRPKGGKEVSRRFFSYSLSSHFYQNKFIAIATSSGGQANLSPSQILGAPIEVPPLSQQKAIAAILGALDDKIALNRQMNATLDAMARALFRSWFVDFDPVRARLDGRQAPGLHPATAALFPNEFQDSEFCHIPKGWTAGKLGDVGINSRRGVHPSEISPNTPYIALEHMPRRCIALGDWEDSAGVASGKSAFRKGEILFGKLRPYFHKVGVAPFDGVCSTDILVLAPKNAEWFGFLLGHASSEELVNFTDLASTGTKMPRTNWSDISSFKVALPPKPIAATFTRIIQPMLDRIHANLRESRTLATLRDTLLPKLLSGELAVSKKNA